MDTGNFIPICHCIVIFLSQIQFGRHYAFVMHREIFWHFLGYGLQDMDLTFLLSKPQAIFCIHLKTLSLVTHFDISCKIQNLHFRRKNINAINWTGWDRPRTMKSSKKVWSSVMTVINFIENQKYNRFLHPNECSQRIFLIESCNKIGNMFTKSTLFQNEFNWECHK